MSVICSFFGHAAVGNEIRPALSAEIERQITERHTDTFYVGGYGHFDRMASDLLEEMKKRYPHLTVYHILAYLPASAGKEPYEPRFPTLYPEGLELVPKRVAILRRNRWMVNQSDFIIGYVLTTYGGAYEALRYAKQKKKSIVNIADGT